MIRIGHGDICRGRTRLPAVAAGDVGKRGLYCWVCLYEQVGNRFGDYPIPKIGAIRFAGNCDSILHRHNLANSSRRVLSSQMCGKSPKRFPIRGRKSQEKRRHTVQDGDYRTYCPQANPTTHSQCIP